MAVRTTLAGLLVAALATVPAIAEPPSHGAVHTFLDPVFKGTVFCDTLDQVWAIATAETPNDVYANYRLVTNERQEPMCMAIVPTGTVVEVTPIGIMKRDGHEYRAWAIETDVGGVTAFALYLEQLRLTQV